VFISPPLELNQVTTCGRMIEAYEIRHAMMFEWVRSVCCVAHVPRRWIAAPKPHRFRPCRL